MTAFDPILHRALFTTSATDAQRLWHNDYLLAVLKNSGLFNVAINNTPATPPADSTAIWLLAHATNAAQGDVKLWNGTAPATNAANWVAMTPANLLLYTARNGNTAGFNALLAGIDFSQLTAAQKQAIATALVGDATAKSTLASGLTIPTPITPTINTPAQIRFANLTTGVYRLAIKDLKFTGGDTGYFVAAVTKNNFATSTPLHLFWGVFLVPGGNRLFSWVDDVRFDVRVGGYGSDLYCRTHNGTNLTNTEGCVQLGFVDSYNPTGVFGIQFTNNVNSVTDLGAITLAKL